MDSDEWTRQVLRERDTIEDDEDADAMIAKDVGWLDRAGAVAHFRKAAARTTSLAEREYLLRQAPRLQDS